MAANGSVPVSGPLTAAQLAADMNEELAELYNRATWLLAGISGTNVILASASAWLTAYADGQRFRFKPAADNTGAVTLNINSIGARSVVSAVGAALVSGTLDADSVYVVTYYAADDHFRLEASGSGSGTATPDVDVPFTSSGTFSKASYPGARQFVVTSIGPGGPGTAGGLNGPGAGGQAGGVATKRLLPADLADDVTVTISASLASFGHSTAVVGNAGAAASGQTPGTGAGTATGGDFNFTGPDGGDASEDDGAQARGGDGGTPLGTALGRGGKGGRGAGIGGGPDAGDGQAGWGYGGGGGGGGSKESSSNGGAAGPGAPGFVLVEVRY